MTQQKKTNNMTHQKTKYNITHQKIQYNMTHKKTKYNGLNIAFNIIVAYEKAADKGEYKLHTVRLFLIYHI